MTDDEYAADYQAFVQRVEEHDLRCSCCDVLIHACPSWQQFRLIFNPASTERRLLDSRRKRA